MKRVRLIFLDIDGVLNRHMYNGVAESCDIEPECVEHLNAIVHAVPDASVVLSSAWRYMLHGEAMTFRGFEYMLRTHGVTAKLRIEGATCRDELVALRGDQIAKYLVDRGEFFIESPVIAYVVIDDMDLGISAAGHPFVQTDSVMGLTAEVAQKVVNALGGTEKDGKAMKSQEVGGVMATTDGAKERPDLEAIEARANAATEGPWMKCTARGGLCPCMTVFGDKYADVPVLTTNMVNGPDLEQSALNADFCTHARQDVPALVTYARRLEQELSTALAASALRQREIDRLRTAVGERDEQVAELNGEIELLQAALRTHEG